MYKTVFLDRDGLLNQQAPEHDYIKSWDEFHFLPGVPEAICKLNEAGYLVLVVTNQRGVARSMMRMEDVDAIHEQMRRELATRGAAIQKVYVCPHEVGTCTCRKPDIGLFLQAEQEFRIDKENSWIVGDSDSDVEAGRRYGIRAIKTKSLASAVVEILEADVGCDRNSFHEEHGQNQEDT